MIYLPVGIVNLLVLENMRIHWEIPGRTTPFFTIFTRSGCAARRGATIFRLRRSRAWTSCTPGWIPSRPGRQRALPRAAVRIQRARLRYRRLLTRSTAAWASAPPWRPSRANSTAAGCAWCWTGSSTTSGAISGPSATCRPTGRTRPMPAGSRGSGFWPRAARTATPSL